jgi:hypothetical protein
MRVNRKRALVAGSGALAVGAVALMVTGQTFGFFSAKQASGSNVFTAGTVVVGPSGTADYVCTIHPMSPGDTQASPTDHQCTFHVEYTGNVPAWLGLDLAVTGSAGTPQVPYGGTAAPTAALGLFDGTATGLQLLVKDTGGTSFVDNGTATAPGTDYYDTADAPTGFPFTAGTADGTLKDLLVGADVTGPTAYTFTVTYELPTSATNAYQGASTTLVLTFHAVQYDSNPAPGGMCTHLGAVCPTSTTTGIRWS